MTHRDDTRIRRRLQVRFWPLSYETSAEVLRACLEDYEVTLAICRNAMARSLKRGDRTGAAMQRVQIERLSDVRRSAIGRMKQVGVI